MSGLDRRLSRVSGGLSARERVVLILRADAEGLPEDASWRRGMPEFQGSEFNHFVGIANGVNHILVPHATVLLSEVETLEARWGWLSAMVALGAERALRLQLDDTAEPQDHHLSPPWTVIRTFGVEGPLRDDSALSDADRGMRALARGLAREIPGRWARLLALQQVVEEVVREFQDDVAIPEVLRDFLLLIRSKLERLYEEGPKLVGELERPEADETILGMLYTGIEAQRGR